ncbi:hypothetical protein HDU98_001062, partial [Podochytrium sp. JEL0797]
MNSASGGLVKRRAAAAGAKNNSSQIKTLADLVRNLVKRQTAPKTRATRLWAKLKDHVRRGFFASLLNETELENATFLDNIENLWNLVHKHSSEASQRKHDSTTEFVMAGWSKIKEAQFVAAKAKGRIDNENGGADNEDRAERKSTVSRSGPRDSIIAAMAASAGSQNDDTERDANVGEDIPTGRKSKVASRAGRNANSDLASQSRSGLGIEGLSFDTVPNVNVTSELRIIAEGLYSQPIIEADYFTVQVNFNRGWKLLLLGLTQAESLGRYMAMCALKLAIPVINDTLLDSSTRQNLVLILVNLMISDERMENRLKAVYLIGIIAQQLGIVREHDNMLLRVFKELIKKLLEIQFREKGFTDNDEKLKYQNENRSMKIYLIYAIGKFTNNGGQYSRYMEDLTVYALANEFSNGDSKLEMRTDGSLKKSAPTGPVFVIKALLSTLVHDVKHTEHNEKYIGAIFKSFVSPLLKVAT